MSLTPLQLEERRLGIGGSDIAPIMGFSPWSTAYDIYLDKIGNAPVKPSTLAMEVGSYMEDFVAHKYESVIRLQKSTCLTTKLPMFVNPQYSYMRCNIDREIHIEDEKTGILECKTANAFRAKDWGESYSEEYPYHYRLQIAYYRALMNAEYVDLAVLIGNNDFRIYRYTKDSKLEEDILNAVHHFWNNHIIPRVPPADITSQTIVDVIPDSSVTADDYILTLVHQMQENKKESKIRETMYKEHKKIVEDYIGDKEALVDDFGNILVSYLFSTRESFDMDKFKLEQSDMYVQYSDFPKPIRTFRLKI